MTEETQIPKVKGRSGLEKVGRSFRDLLVKEILAFTTAGLLAYGTTELGANYLFGGIKSNATLEQQIKDVKNKIKAIEDRQKEKGIVPEWYDRVLKKGELTSSVNALRLQLKTLEAKKITGDAINTLFEYIAFSLSFLFFLGYLRSGIEKILDKRELNWREKAIVDSSNQVIYDLYRKIEALEHKLNEAIENASKVVDSPTNKDESKVQEEIQTIKQTLKTILDELDRLKGLSE
jgi:uncharacterized protein (DUF2164 family)